MTTAEIISLMTLVVTALLAIGGYIQFVLVRANIGAQFDIEFAALGLVNGQPAGDMALVITNLGSNLLVVTRVSYRVKFATDADDGTPGHKDEPTMRASLGVRGPQERTPRIDLFGGPIPVVAHRSIISQRGTQAYRKPLTFPRGTGAVTIWAYCDYHVNIAPFERFLVRAILRPPPGLDFTQGLYDHQVRRTFRLDTDA